ncbi:SAM-dependent methyltransferase [Sphaerisporangium rubeum]|uniref:O-methyltransferase involved in polyketide biosynthesis n=1 Tax=Sphaerisporangium rubeum TaxID=321317 RepID=A0A7X0IG42_9ACTN|nr:SAM-dependent methyltransferase [Sphaerisporangium rubeum]MBB6473368.1 O-methyltransferase involved in polyketide biosynthesis [Sphaerisporangium rubeum]
MAADRLRPVPDEIDISVPHSARIWNYWLGGKDHYPVDREAGDAYARVFPGIVAIARAQRYFLARAVRYLAAEAGVRQFLDVGTGLPTRDNTHEVAQRAAPDARVLYVDNDPLVLAHARALLTGTPEGATSYVDADLRDPGHILKAAAETLDLREPVALMLLGVLGHLPDHDQARDVVRELMDGLAPGSHLVVADSTDTDEAFLRAQRRYNEGGSAPYVLRSRERITAFFDGLDLVPPGVVVLSRWRPDVGTPEPHEEEHEVCGVGRKP